jgi:hypothetical protein
MTDIKRIRTQAELIAVAEKLKVRRDWHEPDEQEVTARVTGADFDNAGNWGSAEVERRRKERAAGTGGYGRLEIYVTLLREGVPVAEVNLADLFAFATGFGGE